MGIESAALDSQRQGFPGDYVDPCHKVFVLVVSRLLILAVVYHQLDAPCCRLRQTTLAVDECMADSFAELFAQAEVFSFGGDHRAFRQGFIGSWKRAKVGPFI